jgi:hypothetical protein
MQPLVVATEDRIEGTLPFEVVPFIRLYEYHNHQPRHFHNLAQTFL